MKGIRQRRQLPQALVPAVSSSTCSVVLGHRDRAFMRDLGAALTTTRLDLVACRRAAVAVAGCIRAEQPDVVLVEEPLPGMPAVQLLELIRRQSPHTAVAVLVDDPAIMGRLLDAGARSVFHTQLSPADLARELARMAAPMQQLRAS